MWLVASNFIIPDFLSLSQFIIMELGPRFNLDIYMFVLFLISPCIEIISLLFATVWAAGNHWQPHEQSKPPTFSLGLGSDSDPSHASGQDTGRAFHISPVRGDLSNRLLTLGQYPHILESDSASEEKTPPVAAGEFVASS